MAAVEPNKVTEPKKISGLHFLLTYQCSRSCPHCFVWGSPGHTATMSREDISRWLEEAVKAGVGRVAFEGGEPFLYFGMLVEAIREARSKGLSVGLVTNGYWAVSPETARIYARAVAEAGASSLMISTDDYHGGLVEADRAENALAAGKAVGLEAYLSRTKLAGVMFRGRAADRLASASAAPHRDWREFEKCPHESLSAPGRVHLDAHGFVHACQGLAIGRATVRPLAEILTGYRPGDYPVIAALIEGGPAGLVRAFGLEKEIGAGSGKYADACHLCYVGRGKLREWGTGREPGREAEARAKRLDLLGPGEMYGQPSS
ncbi:MAG: radical SAM protein [Bacillota bacterium]